MHLCRFALRLPLLSAFALAALPRLAAAQAVEPSGAALDRWQPLGLDSTAGVHDATRPLVRGYELWLVAGYVYNLLEVHDDAAGLTGSLLGHRLGLHLGGSVTLLPRLQLEANLPLVLVQTRAGELPPALGAVGDLPVGGLGALSLAAEYQLLDAAEAWLNLGLVGGLTVPSHAPRDAYLGERNVAFSLAVAASKRVVGLTLAAELGYHWRPTTRFLDARLGPELRLAAGAGYDLEALTTLPLEAAVGWHTGVRHDAPFAQLNESPSELLVEARYRGFAPLVLTAGVGVGLFAGLGTPDLRAFVGVHWLHAPEDRDGDRIADQLDACPDEPEDYDYHHDADGCPDDDRDDDGIEDRVDRCPDEPENDNDFEDEDGCPDTRATVGEGRIDLRGNVLFEVGKAILKEESKQLLDEIAETMRQHPEVKRVRIEGHTDSDGGAEGNMILSQDRADAVRRYLMRKGIDGKRLTAKGYGESRPIVANDTAENKARNRRVDFFIEGEPPPEAAPPVAEPPPTGGAPAADPPPLAPVPPADAPAPSP